MSLGSCRPVVSLLVFLSLALAVGLIPAEAGAQGQGNGGGNGGGPGGGSGGGQGNGPPAHAQERSQGAPPNGGSPPENAPPQEDKAHDGAPAGPEPPKEEAPPTETHTDPPPVAPILVPPVAHFTYELDGPILVVDAIGSYDPDGDILAYVWDWGDGQKIRGSDLEVHAFDDPLGAHRVTLTVIDDDGQVASVSHQIAGWSEPLVASIEAWADGSALIVDGFGSTAGPFLIVSWTWDWGDGSAPSDGPIADHRYATPGSYTVTLTVQDEAGRAATAEHPVIVEPAPPRPAVYAAAAATAEPSTEPLVFTSSGADAPLVLLVGLLAFVTRWARRHA